jgi:hypothetical protein
MPVEDLKRTQLQIKVFHLPYFPHYKTKNPVVNMLSKVKELVRIKNEVDLSLQTPLQFPLLQVSHSSDYME